jgi:hypothetical protein
MNSHLGTFPLIIHNGFYPRMSARCPTPHAEALTTSRGSSQPYAQVGTEACRRTASGYGGQCMQMIPMEHPNGRRARLIRVRFLTLPCEGDIIITGRWIEVLVVPMTKSSSKSICSSILSLGLHIFTSRFEVSPSIELPRFNLPTGHPLQRKWLSTST